MSTRAPIVSISVLTLVVIGCGDSRAPTAAYNSPSVYERVVAAGEIRCAYVSYPPGCIKNPNSGELSGVFVDLLEDAASELGLGVRWVGATFTNFTEVDPKVG